MKKFLGIAYRFRWLILILVLGCLVIGLWWVIAPFIVEDHKERFYPFLHVTYLIWIKSGGDYVLVLSIFLYLGLFLLTQWMFLRPRRGWTIRLAQSGRPLKTAVVGAAFTAMLLSYGAVALLMEIPGWWLNNADGSYGCSDGELAHKVIVLLGPVAFWIVWAIVFYLYWRQGDHYTKIGRMIGGLLAGSLLELMVATGVYLWDPHNQQEECYCVRGSYMSLVFSGTALLWVFGPGIILLFMHKKYCRVSAIALEKRGADT